MCTANGIAWMVHALRRRKHKKGKAKVVVTPYPPPPVTVLDCRVNSEAAFLTG
jgi:hypothetical protein